MKHRVRVENPHPQSLAARVLLERSLDEAERFQWLVFRNAVLDKFKKQNGTLRCHYCGREELLAELPENASRNWLKRLATLDHVVPRSKGGAEMDEGNIVIACHPCNQKKADVVLENRLTRCSTIGCASES